MIDRLEKFLFFLAKLEGGISDHKADKGGLTNHGVTQATYTDYLTKKGKKNKKVSQITSAEVEDIYRTMYYSKVNFVEDELSHYLLFDLAVNSGVGRVIHCIRAVGNPNNSSEILKWRKQFYMNIVKADPSQEVFLKGWLNRLTRIQKEYKIDG